MASLLSNSPSKWGWPKARQITNNVKSRIVNNKWFFSAFERQLLANWMQLLEGFIWRGQSWRNVNNSSTADSHFNSGSYDFRIGGPLSFIELETRLSMCRASTTSNQVPFFSYGGCSYSKISNENLNNECIANVFKMNLEHDNQKLGYV